MKLHALIPVILVSLVWLVAEPAPAESAPDASDVLTEGVVEFSISYEDMGPMASMLPKSEKIYFRPGAVRIDSGQNVSLRGVVAGKNIQMVTAGGLKLAFLVPAEPPATRNELVRFEDTDGRRTIADVKVRQVDGVDREDDSNRLAYWVTDRIDAEWAATPALEGFALDYIQPLGDGFAHRVAQRVEAKALDPSLFAIPEGFERVEIDSLQEIGPVVRERLGGGVKVME